MGRFSYGELLSVMISYSSIKFNCNNLIGTEGSRIKDLRCVLLSAHFRVCVALLDD